MGETTTKILDFLSQNPKVTNSLLAATVAGGVGAMATGLGNKRVGETPSQRRGRIMRNALGAAALGGGGYYALASGLDRLSRPAPMAAKDAVSDTTRKAMNIGSNVAGNPLVMGAGGLLGMKAMQPPGVDGLRTTGLHLERLLPKDPTLKHVTDAANSGKDLHVKGTRKYLTDMFRGVDLDDVSKNGPGIAGTGVRGDSINAIDEVLRTMTSQSAPNMAGLSVSEQKAKALEALRRSLDDAGVTHGAGPIQRSKSVLTGLLTRSGLMPGVTGESLRGKTTNVVLKDAQRFSTHRVRGAKGIAGGLAGAGSLYALSKLLQQGQAEQ